MEFGMEMWGFRESIPLATPFSPSALKHNHLRSDKRGLWETLCLVVQYSSTTGLEQLAGSILPYFTPWLEGLELSLVLHWKRLSASPALLVNMLSPLLGVAPWDAFNHCPNPLRPLKCNCLSS